MVHTDARKCEVSEMLEETMKENSEDIEKKEKKKTCQRRLSRENNQNKKIT